MNRAEKQYIKERKRKLKKQRKEYARKERESVKRQKRELKAKTAPMKRRIRKARFEEFKKNITGFFKNPIKREKVSKSEKILRQQVRKDVRYYTVKRIINLPGKIVKDIRLYIKIRKLWITNFMMGVFENIAHFKYAFKTKELRNAFLKITVNSTVIFVLAFMLSYIVNQAVTVYTAKILGIPSELFSYRIYWPLYTYSSLYSRQVLILIFGMGPLVSFLLGLLFYRLFIVVRYKSVYLKIFFLWTSISSFILFFGAYVSGAVTRTGFIYASEWLFLNNMFDIKEIIFITLSVVALIVIGVLMTKAFLQSSPSRALIEPRIRILYIVSTVILPVLLGIAVLIAINFPNNPAELLLLYLSPILISIVTLFRYNALSLHNVSIMKTDKEYHINLIAIIILLILIIFLRIILYKGVTIG